MRAGRTGLISFACGLVGVGLGVVVTVMLVTNQWAIANWLPSLTQASNHATPTTAQIVEHVIEARSRVAQARRFMSVVDGSNSNERQRQVGALRGAGDAMNRATAAIVTVAEIEGGGWWHSSNACYIAADLFHHAADLVADRASWRPTLTRNILGAEPKWVRTYASARSGESLSGFRELLTAAMSECAPPAA